MKNVWIWRKIALLEFHSPPTGLLMVGHTCAQFPWETNISDAPDGDGDDDDDDDAHNGEDDDGYVMLYVPYN